VLDLSAEDALLPSSSKSFTSFDEIAGFKVLFLYCSSKNISFYDLIDFLGWISILVARFCATISLIF